ncbi:HAD family hydrolase [Candidatus Thorarchaeota archaeon]|nr:MAG: HAD family hydrolase [Candidatus Thorarchaeota archaeon]
MNIKGIEAVIFDLGGTLYEPASDICNLTLQFMEDVGADESTVITDEHIKDALVDANKWLQTYMIDHNVPVHWEPSTKEWIEYDKVLLKGLGVKDNIESLAEQYQERWDQFFDNVKPVLIQGVRETLKGLQQRDFALGIASNRYGDPKQVLQTDSIYDLFGSVEFSGVPGYIKPSPYLLLRVAEQLGINPRKCAYVGNIVEYDCVAAERAEMIPILLSWVDPQEVDKITTDTIVIDHIADLLEVLR